MIKIEKADVTISTAIISTFLGHNGRGMFPYRFMSGHRFLLDVAIANKVTVITKSWTREWLIGNYQARNPFSWRYIQRLNPRSMVNAYGLTNDGVVKHWADSQKSIKMGLQICPSLYPEFEKGKSIATNSTLEMIDCCSTAKLVEINFSCVNAKERIGENNEAILYCLKKVRKSYPRIGIIAKMNIEHSDELYSEIDRQGLADVFHCFNSVRYGYLFPNQRSPLPNGAGGVSGTLIKKEREKRFKEVRQLTSIPMISGGGIESTYDIEQSLRDGADSVSLCTSLAYHIRDSAKLIRDTCDGDT